jgi:hypothetical protein
MLSCLRNAEAELRNHIEIGSLVPGFLLVLLPEHLNYNTGYMQGPGGYGHLAYCLGTDRAAFKFGIGASSEKQFSTHAQIQSNGLFKTRVGKVDPFLGTGVHFASPFRENGDHGERLAFIEGTSAYLPYLLAGLAWNTGSTFKLWKTTCRFPIDLGFKYDGPLEVRNRRVVSADSYYEWDHADRSFLRSEMQEGEIRKFGWYILTSMSFEL